MKNNHSVKALIIKVLFPVFGFVAIKSSPATAQDALLWKISGKEIRDTSYIYGTIHLRDKRVFAFADTVLCYMDLCDMLVLELDLNPLNLLQYTHLMMLPADSTLYDVFQPDDLAVIRETVKKTTGLDFAALEKLKPVILFSLVMQHQMKGDMSFTLDEYLYQKGVERGKEIVGLETFEQQLRLLETIPLEIITGYLKDPLKDKKELELMICKYLESDIDELLLIMQKDETMVALKREFLDNRNRKMAENIDELIHDNSILVAVGAGHLAGNDGLINLLIQRGYNVEPVLPGVEK
ncbi:MAG: TraB/GumN family protein [Bacteroidales bacterium]|nr:TraB/GumN family protein [Bacteroidales bacterium]